MDSEDDLPRRPRRLVKAVGLLVALAFVAPLLGTFVVFVWRVFTSF